jgi:hypothetical protein
MLTMIVVLMGASTAMHRAIPSFESHFYSIEYKKPVKGSESVASLSVVFYVPTDGKVADALLRGQLEFISGSMAPATDILATPWYLKRGEVDEVQIPMPDGSKSMLYSQKYKKVMTLLEYQAAESKTPEGAAVLNVTLDANATMQSNGGVVIEGTTNLPDGTNLMISLRQVASKYFAQAKVTVVGGRFISQAFSNKSAALSKGPYELEVMMPILAVQPEAVQKVAGKNGELLGGPLVKLGAIGKTVEFVKTVEISNP